MERKYIKSGIPGLDAVLGGGILEGSIITVSGPTGAGKSTFAAQFLYNGAKESNEPGLLISIEESRKDFYFHIGGFEMDFANLERDRKFVMLDYPIHEVDQIVLQPTAISEIINSTGVRRVVIDSIMPIALYFRENEERKKGFLKFIENLRRWGVTILIVSEDLKIGGSGSMPSSEYGIESFTDGWINLFFRYDEDKLERARYVEVVKMKGVAHSTRSYPVSLTNKGFSIVLEAPKPKPMGERPLVEEMPPAEKPALKAFAEKSALKAPGTKPSPKTPPAKPQLKRLGGRPSAGPPGTPQAKGKGPVKMSPELAQRLAEAKSKIMKKK